MDFIRLKNSFKYAWTGLKENYRKEQNFRIQLLMGLLVITCAVVLKIDWLRMFALVITIGVVLSFETMNSALERHIDRILPQKDEKIGLAKDILAGAVLITAITSIIVGIIVFYQPIVSLL
ncbi:MAG: diacylglycerol kinase family protein [Patescibacteria group bacterium]